LEFHFEGEALHGVEPANPGYSLYLGSARVDYQSVTDALREFNLPSCIAPGEWEEQTLQETAAILAAIRAD
jgi:hypothetical protein